VLEMMLSLKLSNLESIALYGNSELFQPRLIHDAIRELDLLTCKQQKIGTMGTSKCTIQLRGQSMREYRDYDSEAKDGRLVCQVVKGCSNHYSLVKIYV
jgi:hypothetical protein